MEEYIDLMAVLMKKNKKLKEIFNKIFLLTVESRTGEEVNLHDFFYDVSKRASIIAKFEEMYSYRDVIDIMSEYINVENEIFQLLNQIRSQIHDYEEDMFNIENEKITSKEIISYISCLEGALNNYEKKDFYKPYTFYLDDLSYRYKGNEQKSPFLDEGKKLTISIKRNQMFHLLGLPNLNNKNEIIVQFFEDYCQRYNIECLEEKYIKFFKNEYGLNKYLSIFLLREKNLSKDDKNIYDKFNEQHKSIEKVLKKFIWKSFVKAINFRKVYEFKLIPEIILDYSGKYVGEEKEEYRYRRYTTAFTPLTKSNSILIESCDKNKLRKVLKNNNYGLSDEDIQKFVNLLIEKNLLCYNTLIEKTKNGEKNNRLKFYLKNKYNSGFAGEQYSYDFTSKKLISDLPPNTMLLSYNSDDLLKQEIYSSYSIVYTIILFCYLIAKDYKQNGKKIELTKNAFLSTKDEIFLKQTMLDFISNKFILNLEHVEKLERLLHSSTNSKNINDALLASLISFFMTKDVNFVDVFNLEIDENLKGELMNHITPYLTNNINREFPINYMEVNKFLKPATIIYDKLYRESKRYNSDVALIGYVVKIGERSNQTNELKKYDDAPLDEVYPKTFSGKTCMQLLYDLRINGFNYFVNYILSGDAPISVGLVFDKGNINLSKEIDIEEELDKHGYCFKNYGKRLR